MTAGSTTNANFVGGDPGVDANSGDEIYEPEKIYAWVKGVEHFKPGGASPRLTRHITSVAMDGALPSFPGLGINTTYKVQFPGPTVQCRPLPDIFLDKFRAYMERDCGGYTTTKSVLVGPFFNESITEKACGLDRAGFTYMSWLTFFGWFWSDMRPSFSVVKDRIQATTRLDPGDFRSFYVASKDWNPEFGNRSPNLKTSYGPWNVLNCSLHHAIYTVNITSSASNISNIADYTVEVLDAVARPSPSDGTIDGRDFDDDMSPSLVRGAIINGYMAILTGFFSVVGGYITNLHDSGKIAIKSNIESSILMYTREMLQYTTATGLGSAGVAGSSWWALTDAERAFNSSYPQEAFRSPNFNHSLGSAIEDLFPRLTLSLLSNPLFVQGSAQRINATIESWPNVYTYRRQNLLISYGVALALTLLSCIFGCMTIYSNGSSYSNTFSTLLRVTRRNLDGFDPLLTARDRTGADPLSRHLAKARVQLSQGEHDEDGVDSGLSTNVHQQRKPSQAISESSVMMDRQSVDEAGPPGVADESMHRPSR
jgi:hypothetical protein